MTSTTFDDLQAQEREKQHETEVLALSGVAAAAVLTIGGLVVGAVILLLSAAMIAG